ncbi:MAG TPA: hypothetical protein VGC40_01745 [Paenirhodobacter sp.]
MTAPRVIIHAGFHKTGTSTVQQTLRAHRDDLAPRWRLGLEADFADAAASGRAYSVGRSALDLGLFQGALADWLDGLDLTGAEGLLISCESLVGEMPGRIGGAPDYGRGTTLMPAMIAAIRAVLGARTAVHVHLSTRAPGPWLESLHWQLTRGGAVDQDFTPFATRMRPAADLEAHARAIAAAIAPDPLTHMALETCATLPQGPLTPILDLMAMPPAQRAQLRPTPANARPTGIDRIALANHFAAINRAGHSRDAAMALKRALLRPVWADQPQETHP